MRALLPMLVPLLVSLIGLSCTAEPTTEVTGPSPVASVSVVPADAVLEVGAATQLAVIARDAFGDTLSGRVTVWTTTDESVARILNVAGSAAMVSGVAPGAAMVIGTTEGKSDTAAISVRSGKPPLPGPPATPPGSPTPPAPPPPPTLTQLVLAPASVTLAPGGTRQFTISGTWSDGSHTVPAVTFAVTGGTMTAGGLYTAGAAPGGYRVMATQQGATKADTSTVTITAPSPTLEAVVLNPASITLQTGGSQQFAASGRRSDGSTTTVSVTYSATGGTITAGALYTAGTTPGGYRVIATQQGGTMADTSAVTISAPPPPPPPPPTPQTLRALATARGFAIGAAVRDSAFRDDTRYRQTLVTQYNSIVPEDATDFWPIHPGPTQYSFAAADALVAFAQANGMAIHGHHLAWYAWIPTWVTSGGYSNAQLRDILRDHITTVVGRYRGKMASWDVVNEVIDNEACFTNQCRLQPSFWLDHLGPEYIDSAFVWAHRADPAAKLYMNDYRTETIMNKSDAVLSLAEGLKGRGIPIDGVGFQMHLLHFFPMPTSAQIQANFNRFASAGLDIRITEMDVDVADGAGAAALAAQGHTYSEVLDACLKVSRCRELTTWGFSDRFNWVPQQFPGYGRALPFDVNYQPKPAFDSLIARLGQL